MLSQALKRPRAQPRPSPRAQLSQNLRVQPRHFPASSPNVGWLTIFFPPALGVKQLYILRIRYFSKRIWEVPKMVVPNNHWFCQRPKGYGSPGRFLKWWYPTTIGFPTKNDHFGVFWGYHYFRKHPYVAQLISNNHLKIKCYQQEMWMSLNLETLKAIWKPFFSHSPNPFYKT